MDIPPLDYKTMLREAKKLESASVPHRSDDSEGWNSLCLHGIEAKKTLSSDKYGYLTEEETPFKWTWASKKAPVTTNYLKKLIALGYYSSVYRIRFMYLKPGGFIKFHQDREEERKSMGPLNIALNMPHHCYWLFEEWGSVPFREGTGFAVDISNRHGLWNFSNETRIHIIIHGVYGDEYYKTIKRSVDIGIRKALVHKRKPPPLSEESISPNKKKSMSSDLEPAFLLWLKNHEVEDPELFRITSNITRHFYMLRRKRKNTVFYSHTSLNYLLSKSYEDGKPWAVVMVPGNVLKEGFYEAVKNLISRADSDVFMFAHIIDRKERWFGLHHQCFIVNLSLWDQIGRPPFIKKATGAIPVPKVIRSLENIHDDYTPVYLKPGYQTTTQHPRVTGWHWIQKILEAGLRIENFPQEIREKKLFLYPEQNQETLLRALNPTL